MTTEANRRCSVYDGTGDCCAQALDLDLETRGRRRPAAPKRADDVLVNDIMTTDIVCARPTLEIAGVVSLMIRHRIGCIPVIDDRRRPIGMITKFDIVEQLDVFM